LDFGFWILESSSMTFLPIVARELRVTARKRSTYWVRFAAAALAMAICAYSFFFLSGWAWPPLPAKSCSAA
jgi:hypothetical protein